MVEAITTAMTDRGNGATIVVIAKLKAKANSPLMIMAKTGNHIVVAPSQRILQNHMNLLANVENDDEDDDDEDNDDDDDEDDDSRGRVRIRIAGLVRT